MAQQLAIIVLVDVGRALQNGTLTDNVYLIDNMKPYGSRNEGSGALVTAVNGTFWSDGSQGIGSTSPALPRGYHSARSRHSDREALAALSESATAADAASSGAELERARSLAGGWLRRGLGSHPPPPPPRPDRPVAEPRTTPRDGAEYP